MSGLDGGNARTRLRLFGGPLVLIDGQRHAVPECCERLMVWLALRRCPIERSVAAGLLWPDVGDRRAAGNLRSALWRLRSAGLELINVGAPALVLRSEVIVDVHVAADWARRVIGGALDEGDLRVVPFFADALNLLPDWRDDWVVLERERLRHRMLHAFEELSRLLCAQGRYSDGIEAARMAVAADPLRESGQCALIAAHRAAGDIVESQRVLQAYAELHQRVFGVGPSSRLR